MKLLLLAVDLILLGLVLCVAAVAYLIGLLMRPRQPVPPPSPAVYRVPTWAARHPARLREHPDLAQVDDRLNAQYQQLATYYLIPERRTTP